MSVDVDAGDSLLTVNRGLQVLRAFRNERTPLSNAEIVARTGLPKSTVSRLTSTLLASGFLRHAPGGRQFELGLGSLGIGHAFLETSPLVRLALPFMQDLADELNVSVALAIRNGFEMLYVAYCSSRNITTLRLGVGAMLPMVSTAIGRAYMWGLSDEDREVLFGELEEHFGGAFEALQKKISESFSELDAMGTCLVKSGYQRDTYGIAVPIRVGVQRTVVGLNCGAAVVGADFAQVRSVIGGRLMRAAPELERLLQDLDHPI
ncbi:IclR family transcriptional regulator [Pseudomonas guariconensis]|uniref:IclR family transcriptional regulator n=1 Tax=Pseudomonas TaxID=286 RepID=UPI002096EAC4|nr:MULTISPECIES: IclR family transcriptional regulator [Pseudomonas]MCO7641136.1 IclR family transcriptional regulator [Pseudomonas sp. S 311-6]MCO7515418.1 IclR family transcriptional regulator [Pseudomonas putida]MCO7566507.1 IclR family transcriptional regulator [Pseudomonas mosselii]MCO7596511.1 IclR family transcriptional regulator [Pseudomonas guariconensis]MCO7605433.1 IclR family transcriptional regulator [Pseudomonas guariconensis]